MYSTPSLTISFGLARRVSSWVISWWLIWAASCRQGVASQPLRKVQERFNVRVVGFYVRYIGAAMICGEWLLDQLIKRPFHLELMQQKDGYDEMVKVLARDWAKESASIAKEKSQQP